MSKRNKSTSPVGSRAAKRHAKARLSRGSLPPTDHDALVEQITERSYWDQYSTEMLWGWLQDYDEVPRLPRGADRDIILDALCETDGVERPTDVSPTGTAKELVDAWCRVTKEAAANAPPVMRVSASAAAAMFSQTTPRLAQATAMDEGDAPLSPLTITTPPPKRGAAKRSPNLKPLPTTVTPLESGTNYPPAITELLAQLRSPAASGAQPRAIADISGLQGQNCLTCTTLHRGPCSSSGAFICVKCRLRGDIPTDHPSNTFLIAQLTPAAAATRVQGQSTETPAAKLSRLDTELVRLAGLGAKKEFTGVGATAPFTVAQCRAYMKTVFNSSKYKAPSEQLTALIRSGNMRDIGYALPQKFLSPLMKDDTESGTLAIDSSNSISLTSKAIRPAAISSGSDFCFALLSTVLPALADCPRSMFEWIALGTTALALEKARGWPTASSYLQRHLEACVNEGRDFGVVCSTTIADIAAEIGPSAVPSRTGQNAPGGGRDRDRPAASRSACNNWNDSAGCARDPCRFTHVCRTCAGSHKVSTCPKGDPYKPVRERFRTPSFVSGSNRDGSGSSVTTKRSTAQPATFVSE